MGKLHGFDLTKARQIGAGNADNVYSGGLDPNQEGGLSLVGNWLSRQATRALLRKLEKGTERQHGGAVQTRRDRATADENEAAAIAAAVGESGKLSSPPLTIRKRTPPKPPPPVRGPALYKDNDLQRFMTVLGLNYNTPGRKTRAHQRLMGWKMHGSKAGQSRVNKLSRLIRQGKAYSVLNWKAGHDDLKFPPSASLLRKYYTAVNELGDLKNPAPSIAEATGRKQKQKRGPLKVKLYKSKKKSKTRKGGKSKSVSNLSSLIDDMNLAENDVESAAIEPMASTSQSGLGFNWKALLGPLGLII